MLISCTSTKKLVRDKSKTKTEEVNSGEMSIKRASDTLEFKIPNIIYKDTTIYKRGRKSTVYLNYDSEGNVIVISNILYVFIGLAFLIVVFRVAIKFI